MVDTRASPTLLDQIEQLTQALEDALGLLSEKYLDENGELPENFCIEHDGQLVEPRQMVVIAASKAMAMASCASI